MSTVCQDWVTVITPAAMVSSVAAACTSVVEVSAVNVPAAAELPPTTAPSSVPPLMSAVVAVTEANAAVSDRLLWASTAHFVPFHTRRA